jgi:hypothetical protein
VYARICRMVVCIVDWLRCFREYDREYRAHALRKMIERNISFDEIDEASGRLDMVKDYEDDTPYPSCLMLGFTKANRPLHVVFAVNHTPQKVYVITVYEPEKSQWTDGFLRRIQ